MAQLLSLHQVDKFYGDSQVLHKIDLDIPEGSISGLLGPNGAGKTTLLRIVTGITAPDSGNLLFSGRTFKASDKYLIGYLPEERGLYKKMSVWEQAVYLTRLKGLSASDTNRSVNDWFERMGMESWRKKRVDTLSKGMQQRLQFVIAVAHNPQLLILDEPFSGFDPIHTEEIKKEILNLKASGTTIILSTHNMASVEELCEHIALLHQGHKLLEGNTNEIRKQFSNNLYKVVFNGSQVAFATALGHQYEIIKLTEFPNRIEAELKSHGAGSSNELLQRLLQSVEIITFQENLPSINDLFLEQISQATKAVKQTHNGE